MRAMKFLGINGRCLAGTLDDRGAAGRLSLRHHGCPERAVCGPAGYNDPLLDKIEASVKSYLLLDRRRIPSVRPRSIRR